MFLFAPVQFDKRLGPLQWVAEKIIIKDNLEVVLVKKNFQITIEIVR